MFELMDADQVSLAEAHRERKEIEILWKQEKDQRKRTQQVRISTPKTPPPNQLHRFWKSASIVRLWKGGHTQLTFR